MRNSSLSDLYLDAWRWEPFFIDMVKQISLFDISPYSIPKDFLYKKAFAGSPKKPVEITTSTWACKFNKIRQIRVACVQGSDSISVMNLVISPLNNYELPFFGADFVTLPNGHLLALDLQPALKMDPIHTNKVWNKLLPLHSKWQQLLPSGGSIPKEAEPYFSPGFLWTRLPLNQESDTIISDVIRPAFREYLNLYIELIKASKAVSDERALKILKGQQLYINYRSKKDPARAMLSRFYGEEWTENYIQKVLFDL